MDYINFSSEIIKLNPELKPLNFQKLVNDVFTNIDKVKILSFPNLNHTDCDSKCMCKLTEYSVFYICVLPVLFQDIPYKGDLKYIGDEIEMGWSVYKFRNVYVYLNFIPEWIQNKHKFKEELSSEEYMCSKYPFQNPLNFPIFKAENK